MGVPCSKRQAGRDLGAVLRRVIARQEPVASARRWLGVAS